MASQLIIPGCIAVLLAALIGCATHNDSGGPSTDKGNSHITGAGTPLAASVMRRWCKEYAIKTSQSADYKSTGSSLAIDMIAEGRATFACIDTPLTAEQAEKLRKKGGPVILVPVALDGVAPIYNLDNTEKPLSFSGPVLAAIFLGKITKWNDSALVKLNAGVSLPDMPILVCYSSDASGNTYLFTEYLSKTSSEWKDKVGCGRTISWPAGVGCKGSEPQSKYVRDNIGSIGYLEFNSVLSHKIKYGHVANFSGKPIRPSPSTFVKAVGAFTKEWKAGTFYSLVNAPADDSYPISRVLWIVTVSNQPEENRMQLAQFLLWICGSGQEYLAAEEFGALPGWLADNAKEAVGQLKAIKK